MTDDPAYPRRAAKVAAILAKFKIPDTPRNEIRWYDKPLVEETAAEMSPELKAVLRRKWHVMGGKWRTEAAE